MSIRVGTGFDAHAFGPGDSVALGGVRVAHTHGVVAHSDGDVILHALCDALLGAAGLGDIGQHFPDTDLRWKGVESHVFLTAVHGLLRERGYVIGNVDLTLLAQAPRIGAYREQICAGIAQWLGLARHCVNLKATTTEHLGFIGRGEGIAALATVLIQQGPSTPA